MSGTEAHDTSTEAISGLPYAQGLSFTQLDDYLNHLRRLAPQDRPYFDEVAPGQYRRIIGRRAPGTPEDPRIYTRQDLLDMYGFKH